MIDKYDVKKAILGGKISLSDVASTSRFTSRPDRYDFGPKIADDRRRQEKSRIPEDEAKKPEMVKADESGSSKSKEIKQPEIEKKDSNGSKYNFIADSYKLWLLQRNENQFEEAMGKIKSEVVPNISLISGIYAYQKNPEFYRYIREYDKIAKRRESLTNAPLEEQLKRNREIYAANGLNEWGQGTISQGKKSTWATEFADWFSEKYEKSPLEGLVKTVGAAATLTAAAYATGFGVPGLILGGMTGFEAYSLATTGKPGDPIEVLSHAADLLPFKNLKTATQAMKGLKIGGAATAAGLGVTEFNEHSSAPKGYRNVQEWELPEDLRKYHTDFSPIAYQWSRADKYLDGVIPSIDDVVSGAPIEEGWEKKASEVISSKYKEYETEALNQIKDKENLTFLGFGIDQPSEKALQLRAKGDEDAYKYGLLTKEGWMSNMATWGGSSTEMASQAISAATAFATYALAGKLSKVNGTPAILASALAPIVTGATYAYTNNISREAETFAGLSTSFDEKQNDFLERNGIILESMSDEELASMISIHDPKSSYRTEEMTPGDRDEIIKGLKLGTIRSNNPAFKKSIDYANEQSDEFIRQYMSMLPADMIDNVLLNAIFARAPISKSIGGNSGVASMFGNAAKSASDFTRASFAKRAAKGIVSKGGKLMAKSAKYKLLSAAEEVFLEETPQLIIDNKYKANVLAENKTTFGSMVDMYSSANAGLMSILGLSNDDRYWSSSELRENALRTLYSTLVMESANINTVLNSKRNISEIVNDVYAEKLITGTILDEMRRTNRESMTDLYVRKMSEGKQQSVLNRMTEILDNLPEGVSRDDMENEIATARKTFQVANSKEVKEYAKRGAGLYSTDHKTLVSLAMDHHVAKKDNDKIRTEKIQKFEEQAKAEFKDSDFYSSIKAAASQANAEISDSQIYNLYTLKAGLEAVNAVKFVDTDNNKFSARKVKRMESSVKNQMENYKNSIEFLLSTFVDANGNRLELDIDDLSVDSPSTLTLAEAIAAKAGADYEQSMYNVLTGKTKNTKDNVTRDAEIDEYLDAYRTARAKDEDYAKTAEEYELAKREVINEPVVKDEVVAEASPLEGDGVDNLLLEAGKLMSGDTDSANDSGVTEGASQPSQSEAKTPAQSKQSAPSLSDSVGKVVVYKGKLFKVGKSGSRYTLSNDNTIYELEVDGSDSISSIGAREFTPRVDSVKYDISSISEKDVTVNGVEYIIRTDKNGNITGLSPKNKKSQTIRNKSMLIAVEIERNKLDRTTVANKIVESDGGYDNAVSDNPELADIEAIYSKNWSDTIAEALDKLYDGLEISESESLALELWLKDAIDSMEAAYVETGIDSYYNAIKNLEIINTLLYEKQNVEQLEKTNTVADYYESEQEEINETGLDDRQEELVVDPLNQYEQTYEDDAIEPADHDVVSENEEDRSEATNEESTEKANTVAADAIEESNIAAELLEDEDSSGFYELEEEFPGSTESAKVDSRFDKLSHTLFTPNKKSQEFLKNPDALEGAKVRITVSRIPDANVPENRRNPNDVNPYKRAFDINNKSTWDEAWIEVEVKSPKYGIHKFSISLPDVAQFRSKIILADGTIKDKFTQEEIAALREYRANIIEEYKKVEEARGKKHLVATKISRGKAKISLNRVNGRAIQRPLGAIKGLIEGFTGKNWESIGVKSITLAYGRGARGLNTVVGVDGVYGTTLEQNSGSIFAVKNDPLTGEPRNIKLNKLRMKDGNGIAELIYKLVVDFGASRRQITFNKSGEIDVAASGDIAELGLTVQKLLMSVVRFGEDTIVPANMREKFKHLIPKQFFVENGILTFGENTMSISNPDTISAAEKQALIDYIKENFHWTVDKDMLWNQQGGDNRVSDVFPSLRGYFNSNKGVKSVKFSDGFEISREDMGLTWTGWLVKNGKLVSDLGDGVFDAPFTYLNDVRATQIVQPDVSIVEKSESLKTPENASNDIEDKKADIERRRQEDLDDIGIIEWSNVNGFNSPLFGIKRRHESGNHLGYVGHDNIEIREWSEKEVEDAINAKYDAELAALDNPSTDTAAASKGAGSTGTIFDMKANKKIIVGKPSKTKEYEYEAGSPDQEVEWIKSILGNEIAVEVYDHVLTMDNGVAAMGAMIGDSILLWEGAEKGTGFHEAFHFVSLMVLPRNRRMMVYESVRNSVVGMKDATNSEIEEYLAEEYRDYMLHSQNGIQNKRRPNIIRTTFRRIMNVIRSFVGLDNNSKERLFKDISMGLYVNKKPSGKNIREFRIKYGDGAARMLKDKPYKAIKTLDLQYSIAKGLTNMMLSISNVREAKDIENINKSKWNEMRNTLSNTVAYMEQRPDEFSQETIDVYKDIRDTFDSEFVPLIKKEMKSMAIVESTDNDSDESIIGQELARFDKADYQISRKNSVPAEVKFFISTIDRLVEVEGGAESYVNQVTMMKEFIDPDISWKKLIDDLHDEYGFEMMIDKINELANNGDLYYIALREKMNDVSEDLKTKFFVSIFSHRHDFINISYNPAATSDNANATIQLIDAKLDSAKRKMPKVWGENFISNGFIYSEKDGVLSFNKDNASSLLGSYEKLQSKYNKVKNSSRTVSDEELISDMNEYVAGLNLIGISVDIETINSYMNFKYKRLPKDEAFARVITDAKASSPSLIFSNILTSIVNNDGKVMVTKRKEAKDKKDVFKGSKAVETLAKSFAKTHPVPQEAISIGADGAKVYEIALRNYIINTVTKLNKNKQYLSGLKNVSYVAGEVIPNGGLNGSDAINGSIILNQLLNDPTSELQVKTFLKFYKDRSGDKGRDYFGISKLEDYVVKMAAAMNGYIVLPAMADKKTYYFLSGITMPNFIENPITYNADGTMVFPVESLRILDGYFNAEYIAIKDAWNEYVEQGGNKANLIDVYHVNGVNQRGANQFTNKKGAWNSGLGNGMHFRHFDQMYVRKSDGSSVSINLNDVMESYIADMGLENGMNAFFEFMEFNYFGDGQSHTDRLKMINSTIVSAMKTEISWLRDAGAVSVNGRNIENVSLDSVLVEKMYSEFIAQAAASGIKTSVVDFSRNASVLNMVAANLMNTYISNIEFEKLFSKDPAFYKDPDAKTKRLSSPLSTTTSLRTDFPVGHELHGKNSFISAELLDNEIASAQIDILRAKMTAAQFNELMRQSGNEPIYDMDRIIAENGDELQRIKDEFKKQFDAAEALAKKAYAGYEFGINETDATVYISPSMYRSILIRLGRWDDETKEAFKLIQSDDVSWMTDDAKYLDVMNVLFNPLKMIYFGSSFKGNLEVPKLDKMAMFPLFKSIATGDLEALYNRMNHPAENQRAIDMVAFNSAVKVGNNHPISFYEDETNTSISDLGKLREEEQYFEYLGHQLETEPHHGAMVNMATQVQKVGMSNIDKSRLYSNIKINGQDGASGSQLIEEWKNAIVELSNRGVANIHKKLGIKEDEDTGDLTVDKALLYKFLVDEANKSDMPDDVISMLESFDENDLDSVSLQALFDNAWVESKIVSYVMKETIDIETPGGMFIQMSAFGVKSIDDKNHEYRLNGGKRLNFMNPDGSMDAVVSLSLFKDIIPADIQRKSPKKQKEWLILHNIIGENANPIAIGYRIPTQGLSSISGLRIVDVLPANIGDTIVLPSEFTKLTGSDFDVDKLFVSRYNFKKQSSGRMEKVEFDDSLENKWASNSTEAVQNRLLDVLLAVITEPMSVHETRIPLDNTTDILKSDVLADIESISPKSKTNQAFKFISPSYQTDKKSEYSSAKRNLGPFALANTHHVLTQIAELKFKEKGIAKKFSLTDIGAVYGRDGIRILDWLSAMINAHVDIAKDPYIVRLGVNSHTIKHAIMLLRTGVGKDTFYFLSQPALKELYSIMDKYSGEYGVTADKNDLYLDANVDMLIDKYRSMAEALAKNDKELKALEDAVKIDKYGRSDAKNSHVLKNENLREWMQNQDKESFWWAYHQMQVLYAFKEMSPLANELAELIKYSQIDTKKAGTSFSDQRSYLEGIYKIIYDNAGKSGLLAGVSDFFKDTFLMDKSINSIGTIMTIGQGLLFRTAPSIISAARRISTLSMGNRKNKANLESNVFRYIDSKIKSEFYDKFAKDNGISIEGLFFGENSVAKKLYRIKRDIANGKLESLRNNEFIKSITYVLSGVEGNINPDYITLLNSNSDDPNISEKIKNYFNELLTNSDPELVQFAKEFILYQFYTSGDNKTLNYVKISEEDRKSIGYYRFINEKMQLVESDELPITDSDIDDIYLNRWYDNDLVPVKKIEISKGQEFDQITGTFIESKEILPNITAASKLLTKGGKVEGAEYALAFVDKRASVNGISSDGVKSFVPYVKVLAENSIGESTYVLYKLFGTVLAPGRDGQNERFPVYLAVDKKGDRSLGVPVVEYNSESSVLSKNILPSKADPSTIIELLRKNRPNSQFTLLLDTFTPVNHLDVMDSKLDFSDEDMNYGDSDSDVINAAVDSAISAKDYSIEHIESAIANEGITDTDRINNIKSLYAEAILRRFKDFNQQDGIIDQSDEESGLNELRMRIEAYMQPYLQSSEIAVTEDVVNVEPEIQQEEINDSVNIEFYEENGTLYQFITEPGEPMSGQYKQQGQEWKDLSNPEKTLRRLKSGKSTQVEVQSPPSVAATASTARKVTIFGKSIDLSKIGITFDLNNGQKSAIDAVSEWFATETNEPFVIKGYAGTGKTSITRIITSGLSANGIKFKVAAFTHQAKKVASKATKSKAVTLFSLLSMQHIGSEAEVGGVSKFSEATSEKIPYDGVVIVDEASMVGDTMRETILSMAKENNSRVIFIGDPGQLPPVENKDALGRPKMSEALESSFSSELTEVMRVSNGNKIIDVATAARKAQQTDLIIKHGDVAMSGYARRSSFNEIGGGFYVGEAGRAATVKLFIEKFFKSKLFASDPTYAKIIAYRNVSVDAYNDMVRSALGKTGIVEVGESLIGQDNLYASIPGGAKRPLLLNGDEYTVVGVGEQEIIYSDAVPGVEIPVIRIDITTDSSDSAGGSFYLLSDYSDEKMDEIQGAILQKQAEISRTYMDDKYMLKRARAIFYNSLKSDFVTLKNISNPNKLTDKDSDSLKQRMLRHGYAITAHKSQGSEFNNILVDDSDIRRMAGNLDDIFYKKALYTAITRAKDRAIIITNGDRYDATTGAKIPANEQNEVPSIMLDNDLLEQMASSEIRPSDNC